MTSEDQTQNNGRSEHLPLRSYQEIQIDPYLLHANSQCTLSADDAMRAQSQLQLLCRYSEWKGGDPKISRLLPVSMWLTIDKEKSQKCVGILRKETFLLYKSWDILEPTEQINSSQPEWQPNIYNVNRLNMCSWHQTVHPILLHRIRQCVSQCLQLTVIDDTDCIRQCFADRNVL